MLVTTPVFCQVKVSNQYHKFNNTQGNAYVVPVMYFTTSEILKETKRFVSDYKGKVKISSDELFMDDGNIPELSGNVIDIYANTRTKGADTTELIIGFYTGTEFVSEKVNASQDKTAKQIVFALGDRLNRLAIEEKLIEANKELKQLNRNLENLKREKTRNEKIIASAKERILKAEAAIEQNAAGQDSKQAEIELQQNVIQDIEALLLKFQ